MGGCVFQLFYSSPSGGYIENSNEKKGKNLERETNQKGSQIYGRMIFNAVSLKAALPREAELQDQRQNKKKTFITSLALYIALVFYFM